MLSKLYRTDQAWTNDKYFVFTMELFHLFILAYPSDWKNVLPRTYCYMIKFVHTWKEEPTKEADPTKTKVFYECNNTLAVNRRYVSVIELNTNFSSSENTGSLKGFVTLHGAKGMKEWRDWLASDTVIQFLAALMSTEMGSPESQVLRSTPRTYSEPLNLLFPANCETTSTLNISTPIEIDVWILAGNEPFQP